MTGFVLTPAAQADIENIWDYTVARWNVDQVSGDTTDWPSGDMRNWPPR